jgi:hypothetical protein
MIQVDDHFSLPTQIREFFDFDAGVEAGGLRRNARFLKRFGRGE